MRTTLTLDDDLFRAARTLAAERGASIGAIVSDLALKGLRTARPAAVRGGFPVFAVGAGATPITIEDVKRADDEP
jgi:hypothetical protein